MPTALITGITGQDGSYLAEFLLNQGYKVVGLVRRTSTVSFERIRHIQKRLTLVSGDLLGRSPAGVLAVALNAVELRARQEAQIHHHLADRSLVPVGRRLPLPLAGLAELFPRYQVVLDHQPTNLAIFGCVRHKRTFREGVGFGLSTVP